MTPWRGHQNYNGQSTGNWPDLHSMKTIHKSVLIWYSPKEMFDLVTAVADYPKFLPWCDQAKVLEQHDQGATAEVGIAFAGIRQTFTTRNVHVVGHQVDMQLISGPFSELEGQWQFHTIGPEDQRACKVEFKLRYGFSNMALATMVGPVFDKIAGSLVDAFVQRAKQVYGD